MTLKDEITVLKGIGPKQAAAYARLGVETLEDLICHLPKRWQDLSQITPIAELVAGPVTIKARISHLRTRRIPYKGLAVTDGLAEDETGCVRLLWFNQPFLVNSIRGNQEYYLSGDYAFKYRKLQLVNPNLELVSQTSEAHRVKPVYSSTKGLSSKLIANHILSLKDQFFNLSQDLEYLPAWLLESAGLTNLPMTLYRLHFPQALSAGEDAKVEMSLRDLLLINLAAKLLKKQYSNHLAEPIPVKKEALRLLTGQLDFQLTGQQDQIVADISREMSSRREPLNCLIQGDVGSGKTIIALLLAFNVIQNPGYQVALLVPTEILANQHFASFREVLRGLIKPDQLGLLSASLKAKEKSEIRRRLASGQLQIIVGTHALLSSSLEFKNLQFLIIDEQHRFGVEQRRNLINKSGKVIHVLTLSATPIPRSLQLVVFNELDIRLLSQKPAVNQSAVQTEIVLPKDRLAILKRVLSQTGPDNQVYIICPVINRAEQADSLQDMAETLNDLGFTYGLLHGRLASQKKSQVIADFRDRRYDILLSTSMIGAGIDISSARSIFIMSAERFGLAQLHQFRGRVGRGRPDGHCYLCPSRELESYQRLKAVLEVNDGFRLSEIDLELRGPGSIYGLRQTGKIDLNLTAISSAEAVRRATKAADKFIERRAEVDRYPGLKARIQDYQQIIHLN